MYQSVIFSDSHCANCDIELLDEDAKITSFLHHQDQTNVGQPVKVKVSTIDALSAIFQAEFKCNQVITGNAIGKTSVVKEDTRTVPFCLACSLALAHLYRFYLEFVQLSSKNSKLQQVVKNTLDWIEREQHRESDQIQQIIKREPVEDVEVVPEIEGYNTRCEESFGESHNSGGPSDREFEDSDKDPDYAKQPKPKTRKKKKIPRPQQTKSTDTKTSPRIKVKVNSKLKICSLCPKVFKDNHGLRQHLLVHSEERNYKCTECPMAYKESRKLRYHMNSKHGIGDKLPDRTCKTCGMYFAIPSRLSTHLRNVHATERPFICEICGQNFPSKNYLDIHFMTHERTTHVKCDQCGKELAHKGSLREHIESVHLKKRDFACDKCHKTFGRQTYLNEHLKTHEENRERSFKCKYCDSAFYDKKSLRIHEKKHVTGFDFSCEVCGAAFKNKNSLKEHNLAKHSSTEPDFLCRICGKAFKLKSLLSQHMRSKTHGGTGHYSDRLKNGQTTRKIPPIVTKAILLKVAV